MLGDFSPLSLRKNPPNNSTRVETIRALKVLKVEVLRTSDPKGSLTGKCAVGASTLDGRRPSLGLRHSLLDVHSTSKIDDCFKNKKVLDYKMQLRSGTCKGEDDKEYQHEKLSDMSQPKSSIFNKKREGVSQNMTSHCLNESMVHFIHKINHEENKSIKIHHIFDFYHFLKKSKDIILIPKYKLFIEVVVEKTRIHMKTLEEKYFPEMTTTLEKIAMFDCYYMLSIVRNMYKKYLATLGSSSSSTVLAPTPT